MITNENNMKSMLEKHDNLIDSKVSNSINT